MGQGAVAGFPESVRRVLAEPLLLSGSVCGHRCSGVTVLLCAGVSGSVSVHSVVLSLSLSLSLSLFLSLYLC